VGTDGDSVSLSGLVYVLFHFFDRVLPQLCWPGQHGYGLDVAVCVHQRVDVYGAGDVALQRLRRSYGLYGVKELRQSE
jgi:hypothetical protein